MPRYAVELEFAGRGFNGTQAQAVDRGRTVHLVVSQALATLTGAEAPDIRIASRLDSGVSAERLPADFHLEKTWDPSRLALALCDHLPADISVRRIAAVADAFHCRNHAAGKIYVYTVVRRHTRPIAGRAAWWVRRLDDPERLAAFAPMLVGTHDLSAFACLRRDDTDANDPVRTITAASWRVTPDHGEELLEFTVEGQGFLYKQVRGFVGAMIGACQVEDGVERFSAIIHHGRGAPRIGNLAPPEGLRLVRVQYAREPDWITP